MRASGDPYFAHPIEVAGILTDYRLDTADHRHRPAARRHRGHRRSPARTSPSCSARRSPSWSRASPSSPSWSCTAEHTAPGREPAQVHPGHLQGRARAAGQAGRPAAQHAHAALHQEPGQARAHRPRDPRHLRARWPAPSAATASAPSWRSWPSSTSTRWPATPSSAGWRRCAHEQGGAVADGRRAKSPAGWRRPASPARVYRPREAALFDLAQAAAQVGRLLAAVRHLRLPGDRRHRGRLLPRAGRHPPRLAVRARAVQGLHLHAQAQQLPLAAHHRGRPQGHAHRDADPHRGHGPGGRGGRRRPLALQGPAPTASTPRPPRPAGGRDPLVNLRHLVQVLEHGGDAEELVEHAKLEMFLDQVFVFTPKGQLVSLPRGAMPLDFAYAVHTDVGDTTIGVKINGELKPLRTPLQNGDVVEVDPRRQAGGAARLALADRHRPRPLGHPPPHPPDREGGVRPARPRLRRPGLRRAPASRRTDVSLRPALDRFAVASEDDLYDAVGRGRVTPAQVLEAVFPGLKDSERDGRHRAPPHRGRQGRAALRARRRPDARASSLHFAECCSPVPGDRIVGILRAATKGLTVHTIDCPRLAEFEDQEELWRDLHWTPEAETQHRRPRPPDRHHPQRARRAGPGLHHHRRGRRQHRQPAHAPPPGRTSSTSTSTSRSMDART